MKQAIVIRTDLQMGKGKLAGQVAHASHLLADAAVNAYWDSRGAPISDRAKWYNEWMKTLYRKVVLKADSESEILRLFDEAQRAGIPAVIIRDAGLTQLEAGTITCVGMGPCPDELLDKITGNLKLL